MFEDLRKDGESSPFFQQEEELDPLLDAPMKKKSGGGGGLNIKFNRNFLGMSPFQRFFASFALLIVVCVAGIALLLISGAIVIFY
jgi:hypothetical protein